MSTSTKPQFVDPWAEAYKDNLQRRDCPPLQEGTDFSFIDPKFAPLDDRGAGSGSLQLKRFLEQQINKDQEPTIVHASGIPFKVYFKAETWHADGVTQDGQRHRFTAATREDVLGKIAHIQAKEPFRDLTEAEELHITRLAQSGDESAAFGQYFLSRIGPHVAEMEDPFEIINSLKYRSICDEAAYFIWAARTDSYIPDPEFEERLAQVAQSKPLSGKLITHIWIQYLDEKQSRDRQALFSRLSSPEQEAESPDPRAVAEGIDGMTDEQVNKLYANTVREVADNNRRRR